MDYPKRGGEDVVFTYKGKTSNEMYLKIENNLVFTAPQRDIEFVSVDGRDGDIAFDKQRYESIIRSIPCTLMPNDRLDIEQLIHDIHDWLSTDVRYHDFTWSGDPNFVYKAIVSEGYDIHRLLSRYGKTVLAFRFHPIKYLLSSLSERSVANNLTINNPYNIPAKPIIRLIGNGNMQIYIGGDLLDLRNVLNGITIDCETQTVTSANGQFTEFDKMFSYPFPSLNPGNNTITFSGNVQEMYITPRLGALI